MSIGGHMLGAKKLSRLRALTGLHLERAYIRNKECRGVVWPESGGCEHYEIDPKSGTFTKETDPFHWSSCPREALEQ